MDEWITLTQREDMAPYALTFHHHDSHELIFLEEGNARFWVGGRRYEARRGSLLLISQLETHGVEVLTWPYRRTYVLIRPEGLHQMLGEPELEALFCYRPDTFNHLLQLNEKETIHFSALLADMFQEHHGQKVFWANRMQNLFQELMIRIYREHADHFPSYRVPATGRDMLEIQRYIDAHDLNDLRLDEVAQRFHISMHHLSHAFHRATGYGFKEYVIRRRIQLAIRLLIQTDVTISQIAAQSGFHSVHHFIRTFRKWNGTTPLQFRKQALASHSPNIPITQVLL